MQTSRSNQMPKIPIRFDRVAAAFDEVTKAARICESSGSEHSADEESPVDLSDLVVSFMERDGVETVHLEDNDAQHEIDSTSNGEETSNSYKNNCSDAEIHGQLRDLFKELKNYEYGERIRLEVEAALVVIDNEAIPRDMFKRRLMTILREKGFDAGLCKSKWEKSPRIPAGDYQYIDVKLQDGTRFIVEPFLEGSFQIARPSGNYILLLTLLPNVFVGRPEELKQVVKLMCLAIQRSMRSTDLNIPPWRKNRYMQAKWFGSYKRTTNKFQSKESSGTGTDVEFDASQRVTYPCRDDLRCKHFQRTGHLSATFA